MKDKYDYVLQEDMYDCGVACLRTIFLQFGKIIRKEDIINRKFEQGLTAKEIVDTSTKLGIKARGVRSNLESFDFKYLPAIAHVIKDKTYYHYVVILKNDKKKKVLTVMDPAVGILNMSYHEFMDIYTEIFIIFDKKEYIKIKDKRFRKLIKNLLFGNKKLVIFIVLLSLFIIFLTLIFNYFLTLIIKYTNTNIVFKISFIFIFVVLIKNLFKYIRNKIIIELNKSIDKTINNKVIAHILNLPYECWSNKNVGESVSLINDIANIKDIVVKIFTLLLVDVLILVIILVFVSYYSFYYTLIFICLMLILFIISINYQPGFNNSYLRLKRNKMYFNSYLIEVFNSYNSIKNLNLEKAISNKLDSKFDEVLNNEKDYSTKNNSYEFITDIIIEVFYIVVIFISVLISIKTKSYIFNIIFFSNLYNLLIIFLNNINEVIITYKIYKTSITNILDLLDIKEEDICCCDNLFKEKIVLKNICYSYQNKKIFDNANFIICNKDKILISGSSEIDKTTLIKILLKYYELDSGNIYFDGINQRYLTNNNIRNNIVYVSQEEKIFNDSLYNNLKIINSNEEEIKKVIDICMIKLDKNYILEENAKNISASDRKKIIIARALLTNKNIMIFDETFNEIDIKEEKIILSNIINNYKNLTILVISNRENNKDLFSKHYKIKNKKIMEVKK